jgi:hypothetical protein
LIATKRLKIHNKKVERRESSVETTSHKLLATSYFLVTLDSRSAQADRSYQLSWPQKIMSLKNWYRICPNYFSIFLRLNNAQIWE